MNDDVVVAVAVDDHANPNWITTAIETINEANSPLILSSTSGNSDSGSDDDNNINNNNNVITPDCDEKFKYLGQTDINRIITVASFPTQDGDSWSPPCLMCVGFPTAPHGGLTVKANDLWTADNATSLKPSNIKGPTPSSSSMFMFGTFSNKRGKKDPPPEDAQPPHLSPSSPLGIPASDGILCW